MMRSEGKITRENALEIIRKFAKEYRKELGKVPGEIIFVGGGSIMLNYKFRDATQDFDVILKTVSGIQDVISKFADDNDLPRDWMKQICCMDLDALKNQLQSQYDKEHEIGNRIIQYIDHGASIGTENVENVILKIKAKMNKA